MHETSRVVPFCNKLFLLEKAVAENEGLNSLLVDF